MPESTARKQENEEKTRSKPEPRHPIWGSEQKIKALMKEPPIKSGSNRYRNMQVVMQSKTVGEALKRLRELSPPGVSADITLAVKKKAIEIE